MTDTRKGDTVLACIVAGGIGVFGGLIGWTAGTEQTTRAFSVRMAWDPGRTEVNCEQRENGTWCEVDHIPAFTGVRVWLKADVFSCMKNPENVVSITAKATSTFGWYEICTDPPHGIVLEATK